MTLCPVCDEPYAGTIRHIIRKEIVDTYIHDYKIECVWLVGYEVGCTWKAKFLRLETEHALK